MIPGDKHPAPLFANQHRTPDGRGLINDMFVFVDQPVQHTAPQECFEQPTKTTINYNLDLKPGWNRLRVTYEINPETSRPESSIVTVRRTEHFDGEWGVGR